MRSTILRLKTNATLFVIHFNSKIIQQKAMAKLKTEFWKKARESCFIDL